MQTYNQLRSHTTSCSPLEGHQAISEKFQCWPFLKMTGIKWVLSTLTAKQLQKGKIPGIYHFSLKIRKIPRTIMFFFYSSMDHLLSVFPCPPTHPKIQRMSLTTYGHSATATSSGGDFFPQKTHAADAQLWSARCGE